MDQALRALGLAICGPWLLDLRHLLLRTARFCLARACLHTLVHQDNIDATTGVLPDSAGPQSETIGPLARRGHCLAHDRGLSVVAPTQLHDGVSVRGHPGYLTCMVSCKNDTENHPQSTTLLTSKSYTRITMSRQGKQIRFVFLALCIECASSRPCP